MSAASHIRSVLVVDDFGDVAKTMAAHLELSRFKAVHCEAGARAMYLMGEQQFDACVVDVFLPGMSGVELAKRIRTEFAGSCPRLVGITADRSPEGSSRCAAAFDTIVFKPFNRVRLVDALGGEPR